MNEVDNLVASLENHTIIDDEGIINAIVKATSTSDGLAGLRVSIEKCNNTDLSHLFELYTNALNPLPLNAQRRNIIQMMLELKGHNIPPLKSVEELTQHLTELGYLEVLTSLDHICFRIIILKWLHSLKSKDKIATSYLDERYDVVLARLKEVEAACLVTAYNVLRVVAAVFEFSQKLAYRCVAEATWLNDTSTDGGDMSLRPCIRVFLYVILCGKETQIDSLRAKLATCYEKGFNSVDKEIIRVKALKATHPTRIACQKFMSAYDTLDRSLFPVRTTSNSTKSKANSESTLASQNGQAYTYGHYAMKPDFHSNGSSSVSLEYFNSHDVDYCCKSSEAHMKGKCKDHDNSIWDPTQVADTRTEVELTRYQENSSGEQNNLFINSPVNTSMHTVTQEMSVEGREAIDENFNNLVGNLDVHLQIHDLQDSNAQLRQQNEELWNEIQWRDQAMYGLSQQVEQMKIYQEQQTRQVVELMSTVHVRDQEIFMLRHQLQGMQAKVDPVLQKGYEEYMLWRANQDALLLQQQLPQQHQQHQREQSTSHVSNEVNCMSRSYDDNSVDITYDMDTAQDGDCFLIQFDLANPDCPAPTIIAHSNDCGSNNGSDINSSRIEASSTQSQNPTRKSELDNSDKSAAPSSTVSSQQPSQLSVNVSLQLSTVYNHYVNSDSHIIDGNSSESVSGICSVNKLCSSPSKKRRQEELPN